MWHNNPESRKIARNMHRCTFVCKHAVCGSDRCPINYTSEYSKQGGDVFQSHERSGYAEGNAHLMPYEIGH